jgi:hypothetical protein
VNSGDKVFGTDGEWVEDAHSMVLNTKGVWVPDIPLPFYRTKYCCPEQCERSFWTMRGYRGHYALEHILKLKAN